MLKKTTLVLLPLLLSNPVAASEALNADDVKALFSNKTFDIHNVVKDKNLSGYDSDDGQHLVYIPWKDKVSKRKWWLEGNKHCTSHPKQGDNCKLIKPAGDGVYHGISDGEHTHTLSNFRDGNQL
jgi:hypothetical protein